MDKDTDNIRMKLDIIKEQNFIAFQFRQMKLTHKII
jgi:hypothetical protein